VAVESKEVGAVEESGERDRERRTGNATATSPLRADKDKIG
jgi:hypothetical protein